MTQPDLVASSSRFAEPVLRHRPNLTPRETRLAATRLRMLERLVRAIEDELEDETLTDEQKLLHIAERVAAAMDGS